MSDVLIEIEHVSKKFSRDFRKGSMNGIKRIFYEVAGVRLSTEKFTSGEFLALNDVSLKVKRGEVLGLVGVNGAGKSTLLKHIGGIYIPDDGTVKVRGHVEALIELGAGFHPLLTGRENVFQRVSLLGVNKAEEKRLIDEIIDFSELEEFIDLPMKNYSSGMQARLGFASAVLCKPDVLLIDEVLSVGDFAFRQKCLAKINSIRNDAAIVFVSHSDQSMRLFCTRGVLIGKGKIEKDGPIDEVLNYYYDAYSQGKRPLKSTVGEEFQNQNKIEFVEARWLTINREEKDHFSSQEKLILNVKVKFKRGVSFHNLIMGVPFYRDSIYLGALSNEYINHNFKIDGEFLEADFVVDNSFNRGNIDSLVTLYDGPECLLRKSLSRIYILNSNSRIHGEFLINFKINQVTI